MQGPPGSGQYSRRSFLLSVSALLGAPGLALEWSDVEAAAQHALSQAKGAASPKAARFLTPGEAADVEAISSQIIPSDDTPGAREAGVVFFIDHALATFFAPLATEFRTQLDHFQAVCGVLHPGKSFATLSSVQQIEFLKTVDFTPFFARMRLLTVLGMFAMPSYGGNRNGAGWALLGFEDQHVFEPPFGYYDRDYPGFTA